MSDSAADNINETSARLIEIGERVNTLRKTRSRLDFIRQRLAEENERKIVLTKQLKKEKKDFDRMEGFSLKLLFYTILNEAGTKKEKEKQEFLAARLKWEQCCEEIKLLEVEEQEKNQELTEFPTIEQEYADVFSKKEEWLLVQKNSHAKQLFENSEKLIGLQDQLRETGEAKAIGIRLLEKLDAISTSLKSASNWGTWDILGGGLLVTLAKRSRMDNAKNEMQNAQHLLNQFNKELSDIRVDGFNMKFNGFTAFADYFLDGLIFDWIVQSSINKAYGVTNELYGKTKTIVRQLAGTLEAFETEKEVIVAQRKQIVESAK